MTQYDVELYQRIEHMLGTQLEQFSAPQEEAMLLMERVLEAQRHAVSARGKDEKQAGGIDGRGGGDNSGV